MSIVRPIRLVKEPDRNLDPHPNSHGQSYLGRHHGPRPLGRRDRGRHHDHPIQCVTSALAPPAASYQNRTCATMLGSLPQESELLVLMM